MKIIAKKLVESGKFSSTTFFFPKKIVKWKQVKITYVILQRPDIITVKKIYILIML